MTTQALLLALMLNRWNKAPVQHLQLPSVQLQGVDGVGTACLASMPSFKTHIVLYTSLQKKKKLFQVLI